MKCGKQIGFECIVVILIIISLTISLIIFRNDSNVIEIIIVALTNSLVYVITKYFESNSQRSERDKEKNENHK